MKNRNLQLSLYHLHIIVKDMSDIVDSFNSNELLPEALFVPIFKYMMVRTCAFYDEVTHQFLINAKSNEARFKKLQKIAEYIISERDKYFPDLYSIRNNVLAHNYRVRDKNKLISVFEYPMHFAFPKYAVEHVINIHLMNGLLSGIKYLYPEIHEIMNENISIPSENMSLTLIDGNNYQLIICEIDNTIQDIATK
ncbi:hypothetical protein [Mucilaginibacter paludis]|uniref:Uncharacterized protein n=1 Tax=Mucilaginibacter paludis DSM 18603 TaxID=714943 RepID=H1YGU6_9SPHI|nr:hypothetical protein [Mucilaginibacter paludis]EHQ26375.1 hypothetical protein Mucpa_2241 [Mucilaginibacter paludis DSM 18603]